MRVRLGVAASTCLLLVAAGLSTTGATSATATATTTIGGPLLASHGVIMRPLPGAPALPAPAALPASSWMVTDLTTGQVLAAKDPHGRFLPASTLKMLTAITLIPRLDPHATEPVTFHDATVTGSRVGLVPNMRYTVAKLFTCLLVVSANDAADTLAGANGGTRRTVAEMNAKARQLQAYDTVAMTPSGLDRPGESTSAYDLTLLAQAGLEMPAFRHYIATVRSTVPAPHHKHFAIYTHNELLTTYPGDIGVKNGYTVAAQGTDVNAATRHGHTIVVTLMHAYPDFWPMAKDLLNWGFRATGKVTPVGQLVQPATHQPAEATSSQPVSHALVTAESASTSHGHGAYMHAAEVVLAGLVVIAGLATLDVRRRRARAARYYRSRLRLPPR